LFALAKIFRTYRLHLNLPDADSVVDTSTCFNPTTFINNLVQLYEHHNNDTQPTVAFFTNFINTQPFQFFIQRTVEAGDELALFERYVRSRLTRLQEKIAKLEVSTMKGWLYKRGQIRKNW
jgi:hypothetical protein